MRIVIEIPTELPKRGVGIYNDNLLRNLAQIDTKNEYYLFTYFFYNYQKKRISLYCPKQENFKLVAKRFPERFANLFEWKCGLHFIENFLIGEKPDIYHSVVTKLPNLHKDIKSVITVYDLKSEIFPERKNNLHKIIQDSCYRATKIIAISKNTKNDLLRYYRIPEEKITVIYPGVDHTTFYPIKNVQILETVKSKYLLPEKFIVGVGPFNPYQKNYQILIKAFSLLLKKDIGHHKLVLVGPKDIACKYLNRLAQELGLKDKVLFVTAASADDLSAIYNLASVMVYPSLYEGFGMPPLEAMACGCPVITSNVSSLPEVVGDAGILIDPQNVEQIKKSICEVVTNETLRTNLKEKGLSQAKKFYWEKAASEVLQVYECLMSG